MKKYIKSVLLAFCSGLLFLISAAALSEAPAIQVFGVLGVIFGAQLLAVACEA